jgi:hypothetical protein
MMLANSKHLKAKLISKFNLFYQIHHALLGRDCLPGHRMYTKVRKSVNADFHKLAKLRSSWLGQQVMSANKNLYLYLQTANMKRTDIKNMPDYFEKYINQVDDIELDDAFQNNINELTTIDVGSLQSLGEKTYAPGKWTIRDIFQHIIDTERVMGYRTLRYARRDGVVPQGYDENLFAANANAQHRSLADILEELKQTHQASRLMFRSFDAKTLQATGTNWNREMSVLAMGFLITGHLIHHLKIIQEKYLPLLYQTA